MSKGDFTRTLEIDQRDEVGILATALNEMVEQLRDVVAEVQTATDNVASGSEELSSSAQSLSQGATEQAASVEEVSSSMEQMTSNIRQNADNAQQTQQIAIKAATDAEEGGKAVAPGCGSHEEHRRENIHHRGDCPPDQPPCPERRHRGGPRRRARQGIRRGLPQKCASLPNAVVRLPPRSANCPLPASRCGKRRTDAFQDGAGHQAHRRTHSGYRGSEQRAERRRRTDQQGRAAT